MLTAPAVGQAMGDGLVQTRTMRNGAKDDRRVFILLILEVLVFPPGLLLYAIYRLLRSVLADDLTAERLMACLCGKANVTRRDRNHPSDTVFTQFEEPSDSLRSSRSTT